MNINSSLEKLIEEKRRVGEKILPAFRRLADEGVITPERVMRCRNIGTKSLLGAFRLIGYEIRREGSSRNWITVSTRDSEYF